MTPNTEDTRSRIERIMNFKCTACFGTGIDQGDNDPMGGSMNTICHYCGGTGLTQEGLNNRRRRIIDKAMDENFEKNRWGKE